MITGINQNVTILGRDFHVQTEVVTRDLDHSVRTRVYLADAAHGEGVARAHGEVFGDVRPANTTVVAQLLDPAWKVEIEVEAVLP